MGSPGSHSSLRRAGICKAHGHPRVLCPVPPHPLSSGCMAAWLRACGTSPGGEGWALRGASRLLRRWAEDAVPGSPALPQDLVTYVELAGDLDTLGAESPCEIKVRFAFLMNGFGKMFSYFFLDIAWWYYQYQRGKKKSLN